MDKEDSYYSQLYSEAAFGSYDTLSDLYSAESLKKDYNLKKGDIDDLQYVSDPIQRAFNLEAAKIFEELCQERGVKKYLQESFIEEEKKKIFFEYEEIKRKLPKAMGLRRTQFMKKMLGELRSKSKFERVLNL